MSRHLIGRGLLIVTLLILPTLEVRAADKKQKGKGKAAAKAVDGDTLGATELIGTIKETPNTERRFTIEVAVPQPGAKSRPGNRNGQRLGRAAGKLQQSEARLLTARSLQQRRRALNNLVNAERQTIRAATGANGTAGNVKMVKKDVELQTTDKVKVRTMIMPDQFDERGNIKKHSPDELAKLKGKDSNLPGYESSVDKLMVSQKVRVYLAARPARNGPKEDALLLGEKKFQVKRIIILDEGSPAPPPKPKKGKKK